MVEGSLHLVKVRVLCSTHDCVFPNCTLLQLSHALFGNSPVFSAPGGKCRASSPPHRSSAVTKPSPGRPCLIAEIMTAIALHHASVRTLALIPLSVMIS